MERADSLNRSGIRAAAALVALGLSFAALTVDGSHPRAPPSKLAGRLLLTGSSTMAPLAAAIAERFQALHPAVQIEIQTGGSGRGLADARAGKADIGMVSRALTDQEGDVAGFAIARDGIAIVVHRANPVARLSDAQIGAIYVGRLRNWKDVGGRDAVITAMAAEADRSSTELFLRYFKIKYADFRAHAVLGDNSLRLKAIAGAPDGIVYLSVGEAERSAQAGAPIKLLPMNAVPATSRDIRRGNYPVSRALTLVTRGLPKGLAKEFINFALSAQVTDVIEKYDFVPYLD